MIRKENDALHEDNHSNEDDNTTTALNIQRQQHK